MAIYTEDGWPEWEEDWFWVKWLRRKGFLDYYDSEAGTDSRGWLSKTWGKAMWRFVIPVLHSLHGLKWQIAWTEDEIEYGYKYLKTCEDGSVTIDLENIERDDLVVLLKDTAPGEARDIHAPRIRKLTDTTITLYTAWSYNCPSCGWEPWAPEDFWKVWNCRVVNGWSGSVPDHMGTCHQWDEEWLCLRCWQVYEFSSGDC